MGYLLPEQAVHKMCPFLTQSSRTQSNCIVDGCMMWRWKDGIEPDVGPDSQAPPGDYEPPTGFCGMSGPPEKPPKTAPTSARSYDASDRPAAMAERAIEGTA
jgi:hypothetical protein